MHGPNRISRTTSAFGDLGADRLDPAGHYRVYYFKEWRLSDVPWSDQLVGADRARVDDSERDYRVPSALVSGVLSCADRCSGPSDFYSRRLGPSPISASGNPGYYYSQRRGTGIDTKSLAACSGSRCGGPVAVTSLPLPNLQRTRTALTSAPSAALFGAA